MLFALTLVLSSLFLPASCQFDDDGGENGFHPDPLTSGLFAILAIFALVYSGLLIWTFIALFTSRGHRAPYALLVPTLIFFAWSNAAYIALIILENIPSLRFFSDTLPVLLLPALGFVLNLFNDWAIILQFLVVIAVLWNRENALRLASDGKSGGHHPALIAVHATLAGLMFILGTASEALNMDINVKYYTTDYFLDNPDALDHRITVRNQLNYAYMSFAVLTAVDVAVTTVLLWRAWKRNTARSADKITNVMLYALVPLYSLLSLLLMIFTIVFSTSGLPPTASATAFESASLADELLVTLLSFAVIVVILVLSIRKVDWTHDGVEPPKPQYWAPQPQFMYGAPAQGPPYGQGQPQPMQYGQLQQPMPYGQPQQPMPMHYGGQPQAQEPYPGAHARLSGYESTPGGYTPPAHDPPSMGTQASASSPGGYSPPPHSVQQGQAVNREKTGFHVA
ncbi:hypothetical protein C8R46DRAFT_300965 [Mycena filopes]|nr:hypothetical protein C8R46DRAFT_300965 [Mycena filopes]